MQKPSYPCVVIMPVGPNADMTFLNDTIASAFAFCQRETRVVMIDNTANGLRQADIHHNDRIDFIRCTNEKAANPLYGGLYYNLSKALRFTLDRYDFEVALRLDDDALLIGSGADQEAMRFFHQHPEVGCLGSYRFTCTGMTRDFTPPKTALRSATSIRAALRHPRSWKFLRHVRALARQNGYEDGAHCLGAVTFFSKACVEKFAALDFLERRELVTAALGEDHIFGMMVMAAGYKIEDFATEGRPLGLAWKGLPASPADLIGMGKKIVHSVKSFGEMDQGTVRAEFRRLLPPLR